MFGSVSGADNEVNSRIERGNPRNCPPPDPDPIAVLIPVLAGQQDASPAVMAEGPRFVTQRRFVDHLRQF